MARMASSKITQNVAEIILLNPLASSHFDNGNSNIARSALIATGIKKFLAKYNPLIARKVTSRIDKVFESDGGEINIKNSPLD